jgi:hypothetical protein
MQAITCRLTEVKAPVAVRGYAKSSFEASKAYFEKLAGVKSPEKFLELTTEHTKSAFETFVAEATKIGDLYKNFAKEAFTPITTKS